MASLVSIVAVSPCGSGLHCQEPGISSCYFSMTVPYRAGGSFSLGTNKSFSSKQSIFLGGCSTYRHLLLLANSQLIKQVPASTSSSRKVSFRKRSSVSSELGTTSDAKVLQSRKTSWDERKALAITEGVCIVVAAASYSMSVLNKQQIPVVFGKRVKEYQVLCSSSDRAPSLLRHMTEPLDVFEANFLVSSSSASEGKLFPRLEDSSTWCVPALWAAIVINAILRNWQRPSKIRHERSIKDFTLDQRVGKLEEDVDGMTTTARMLSRHLEKLGVRFRATKRNLRDPVQETIELVKKTSAIVKELASREESLERELRDTQQVLIVVQEQQMTQLELLKAGMTKSLKSQQAIEDRIMRALSDRSTPPSNVPAEETSPSNSLNGEAVPRSPRLDFMNEIKKFWRGSAATNEASSSSSTSSKDTLAESNRAHSPKGDRKVNIQSDRSVMAPLVETESSVYHPDTRFKEEDYWATTSPASVASNQSSPDEGKASVQQPHQKLKSDSETTSGKLDSFFSSRKGSNSRQGEQHPVSKNVDNLNVHQSSSHSGELSSNGNAPH